MQWVRAACVQPAPCMRVCARSYLGRASIAKTVVDILQHSSSIFGSGSGEWRPRQHPSHCNRLDLVWKMSTSVCQTAATALAAALSAAAAALSAAATALTDKWGGRTTPITPQPFRTRRPSGPEPRLRARAVVQAAAPSSTPATPAIRCHQIITDLHIDVLGNIAKALPVDNLLAFSLTARPLNVARATAMLKLKTKPKALMHSSVALFLWAKSIDCPLPRARPSGKPHSRRLPFVNEVFDSMGDMAWPKRPPPAPELSRALTGNPHPSHVDVRWTRRRRWQDVAWPEGAIAFQSQEGTDHLNYQGGGDDDFFDNHPLALTIPYVYLAPNGSYFTVADLIDAIADFEDDCDNNSSHDYYDEWRGDYFNPSQGERHRADYGQMDR